MGQRPAFITGATGFIGSNLASLLVEQGRDIRVLVRSTSDRRNLPQKGNIDVREGDLRNPSSLRRAIQGCDEIYHVAADYRLWSARPRDIYDSNVNGTRNLLEAAQQEGVGKFIHTSTVGTIGLSVPEHQGKEQIGDEETPLAPDQMKSHYKRSKMEAELLALDFARKGLPVVIVNPSTPIGPRDRKPTPTGRVIVDFVNGDLPAYVETGLNFVSVHDVCRGHVLAAERGRIGERYILGHRNLRMIEFLHLLSQRVGRRVPRVRLPYGIAWAAGYLSTVYADFISKRDPLVPLEGVRMSKRMMFFDSSKAARELGWKPTPLETAIDESLIWFSQNGYFRRS